MDALFLAWSVLFLVTFTPLLSGGMDKVKDVRLVNGPSRYEGTVEYTTDNAMWQTTCGVSFGFHDARLVCEHIGAYGTNRAITDSPFGSDLGPATTYLQCGEDHTTISQCSLLSCSSSTIGAAICYDDDSYLGCFMDNKNNRVLPGDQLIENSTMTIDRCISHCRESTMADYVYAGVEYGEECYCGVAGADYSRVGAAKDRDCQTPCTGDTYSSCGGNGHIAIFRIPEALTTINGDVETRQGSSSQQPTTTHVTSGQNDDTTKASNLTSIKPGEESSTTDDMFLPSNTPAVTMQVGYASNLGVAAGAGGGAVGLVIILVVIIVVVVLYKRRHSRATRKGPLPDQPPDKFDANNYDEIVMDSTLGKGEPSSRHRYEDSIKHVKCGMVSKEPQVNMGFAKDEEDLSALYAVSTKHRPEAEGAELGDLYAMPDKRKKSHVMRNGASKAMEPSTPVTDALYAMPDKSKKATDDDEEDGTEMVENPIYI